MFNVVDENKDGEAAATTEDGKKVSPSAPLIEFRHYGVSAR